MCSICTAYGWELTGKSCARCGVDEGQGIWLDGRGCWVCAPEADHVTGLTLKAWVSTGEPASASR